jgi:hypothetical protein
MTWLVNAPERSRAIPGAGSVGDIGWGTTVLLRPEVRYERSYDNPAYQNGTKKNQLTAAGDMIFFF